MESGRLTLGEGRGRGGKIGREGERGEAGRGRGRLIGKGRAGNKETIEAGLNNDGDGGGGKAEWEGREREEEG